MKKSQQLRARADDYSSPWAKNEVVYFHRYQAVIPVNPWRYFYVVKLQWSWGTSVGKHQSCGRDTWVGFQIFLQTGNFQSQTCAGTQIRKPLNFPALIKGNFWDRDYVCSGINNLEDIITLGELSANGGLRSMRSTLVSPECKKESHGCSAAAQKSSELQ